jgi:D-alanyl-D-alanine carboxypeptidase
MSTARRRRFAAVVTAVAGIGLLAGCTGTADSGTSTTAASTSTSTSTSGTSTSSSVPTTSAAPSGTSTSSAPPSTAPTSSTSPDRAALLDQALAELVAMPGGPPGVIAIVQIGEDRTVHTAGYADVQTKTTPTADDSLRIASVAKAFSGATALALVQAGKLSLTDTLGKILPKQPKAWAKVTLRQLLNHTSGVPEFLGSEGFLTAYQADPDKPPAPATLVATVADKPLDFPSGTQYHYSNTDNFLVGLMVEAVTKLSYADALKTYVAQPLGLTHTSLPSTLALTAPVFHGYEWIPPAPLKDVTDGLAPGWAWASGGVVSTPADLNTFIRGYVGGKLFSGATRKAQQGLFIPAGASEPSGPGLNSASMALFRYQTTCGTMYGHTGNTVGYTQFIAASADGTRSVTVSINLQRTDKSTGQDAAVFQGLQRAELAAVCTAMN